MITTGSAQFPEAAVRNGEAFEICEYGTRPDEAMIRTE
jgi:hypothetical protein